jgi:hypothetical protein
MPIPNVGAPSPIKSVTGLSAADVSLLFGAMPVDAFKTTPDASELRGAQQ